MDISGSLNFRYEIKTMRVSRKRNEMRKACAVIPNDKRIHFADPSGRAVYDVGLWPLAC
jgi:hypothetical protein